LLLAHLLISWWLPVVAVAKVFAEAGRGLAVIEPLLELRVVAHRQNLKFWFNLMLHTPLR
jgi:hypothetical protein